MRSAVGLILLVVLGCKTQQADVKPSYEVDRNVTWNLIWEEQFDQEELDTTKWTKIPRNGADWGNYMTSDPACYELKGGEMHLKGIRNPDRTTDTVPFLTGGIYTKDKFAWQYGKVEIRAKLESATGCWPAIWMLAQDKKYGAYPKNGEIDIMEHLNYEDRIFQTVHSFYTLTLKEKTNPVYYKTTDFDKDEYNVFGLEWFEDALVFTLNGETTHVYPKLDNVHSSQWPFDQPFYLLIDQQLGGSWVGQVNAADLPVSMIVDWVKVYEQQD